MPWEFENQIDQGSKQLNSMNWKKFHVVFKFLAWCRQGKRKVNHRAINYTNEIVNKKIQFKVKVW